MRMITFLAIILLSAATLLLELALVRLFAVQQFYHFAFMAISLALLGAGASGSLLSVQLRRRGGSAWKIAQPVQSARNCFAFGASTLLAYLIINFLPFDSFSIAWDGRQVFYLALYFLAAAAPFVFSGLVVGRELMAAGAERAASHHVYAANLLGSALGSLGSLPALATLGGESATMLAAALGACAGLLFLAPASTASNASSGRRNRSVRLVGASLLVLVTVAFWLATQRRSLLDLRLSPYKSLSVVLQTAGARHTLTRWSASTRLDVVESGAIHIMPGLSLRSTARLPVQAGVFLDGDNLLPLNALAPDSDQAAALSRAMPQSLAFALRPGARTLVLEAGAGLDVLLALAAGARSVTAVEDDDLLVEIMRQDYAAFSHDLYNRADVTVVRQAARVYIEQLVALDAAGYDIVVVSLGDTHHPVTSGAYSLTENYLYTTQAFAGDLATLNDDGLLVITRWLQTPPSESARTLAMLAHALRTTGHDPEQQLIAFRTLRTMTFLASPRPFSAAELRVTRTFLEANNFDAVLYPGITPEALNRYNVLPEPVYHNLFMDVLRAPQATYEAYRFDIRPATDDRPFFFHYFKWRQTPEILATLGTTWQPFGGSGYFVLVALLLLVLLASALLIFSPLMWRSPPRKTVDAAEVARPRVWRLRVLVYFAALGIGFLFVELPLAQRFILVLDEPVTALAVVIFAVLLFSGMGSLTARRWRLSRALGVLVLAIAIYPLVLEPVAALALRYPEGVRVLLSIAMIAPAGYLMGLPFAAGLRVVEDHDPALVPWAWAINGSFSVISAVLAVMLALSWGFSAVLWLGAAAYAVALLALGRLSIRWVQRTGKLSTSQNPVRL